MLVAGRLHLDLDLDRACLAWLALGQRLAPWLAMLVILVMSFFWFALLLLPGSGWVQSRSCFTRASLAKTLPIKVLPSPPPSREPLLLLLHVHSSTCKAINIATFAEHHGVVSLKLYSLSIYLARRCCDVVAIKRQKGMVTRLNPARPLQGWSSLNPYLYRTMHRPNANNPHPHPCHGQVSTAVVPASSSSMVSQSQSPSQPYQSTQTPSP